MFRNREIRLMTIWLIAIVATATIIGFMMQIRAGILVLVATSLLNVVFYAFTKKRYDAIAKISEQMDLVLHNAEHVYISESDEGELAILQSEIVKMTMRIREQNDALKKEKENLADSLADIAHQLRTPLTSLNIILSLLEKSSDEKERKNLLREESELLSRMDWLITSLLKLSRLDAGIVSFKRERCSATELIHTAVRPFQISMELHQVSLIVNLPSESEILGDFNWLVEAIQNIVKNCLESMKSGGTLEITGEDTSLFTKIVIRDSGKGFQKEDLASLFKRFYRGKNTDTVGYGIGMALCKTIIVRQGGTITAKNHPEGGAMFSIRFPK